MLFNDNHLLINLIMIEILGTIFFLGVITICIYLRRYFVRKSLAGCTALITNGDSSIAQELATQLTSRHNCRVVLLKQATGKTALNANPNGVSVFNCNILDNADLEQISQQVSDLFDGIDIVIDNGITEDMIPSQDCREFVETTGERLRATINLLMHFIPKMKDSMCGHFVTIQSIKPDKKPVLSSYREINELINHLSDNQPMFALEMFNRPKIRLTTVLVNEENTNEQINNNGEIRKDNIEEVAERILDGVRANRNAVHISRRSYDFISKYFCRKTESNPIRL